MIHYQRTSANECILATLVLFNLRYMKHFVYSYLVYQHSLVTSIRFQQEASQSSSLNISADEVIKSAFKMI